MEIRRPPTRLEGAGFKIKDIMSGIDMKTLDPFLIWHELPYRFISYKQLQYYNI